jgi:DNA polymerase-3 subunit chi
VPEVAFHFNVPDRLAYAGRLLRKAWRLAGERGARLAAVGDPALMDRLDRNLWVADPLDFVPHLRVPAGALPAAHVVDTSLWLVDATQDLPPGFAMLVSLSDTVPADAGRFERVFEVVSTDPAELGPARQRWRAYQALGFEISRHDLASAAQD